MMNRRRPSAVGLLSLVVWPFAVGGWAPASAQVFFSIAPGTAGLPGSAVSTAPDVQDVYFGPVPFVGTNILAIDNPATMGLLPGDNVDGLHDDGSRNVSVNGLQAPNYIFSVRPGAVGTAGTPVALMAPTNAADTFRVQVGGGHTLSFIDNDIGLSNAAAIESYDALSFDPLRPLAPGARVHFSLARGSPTLAARGWSGADVLTVIVGAPGTLAMSIPHLQLGLRPTDDLDGLIVYGTDADGDGLLSGPSDKAIVYFSVDGASLGAAGTGVASERARNGNVGDIFVSGCGGLNGVVLDGPEYIHLNPADDIDALEVPEGGFGVPGAWPGAPTRDPTTLPPAYRPPSQAKAIGEFWIGICDTTIPEDVFIHAEIKVCDPMGNSMTLGAPDRVKAGGNDAAAKAQIIKDHLIGIMVPKAGGRDKPLFTAVAIMMPPDPTHFPGMPGIVGEVCCAVNQDVIDQGWAVDAICLSMTNWTATVLASSEKRPGANPDCPFFPKIELFVLNTPFEPGVFRATFGNGDPVFPVTVQAISPFGAGESPSSIAAQMASVINGMGGSARAVSNAVEISRAPIEPSSGIALGPRMLEAGAFENDLLIGIRVRLCRSRLAFVINDACPDSLDVVDGPFAFDNSDAETDGLPDPLCLAFGSDQIFNDLWFTYHHAFDSGPVLVQTCGSLFDTRLAVYPPRCFSGPPLACVDDVCGVQSSLTFDAKAGGEYLIRVGSFANGGTGPGTLTITPLVASTCADQGGSIIEAEPNCGIPDTTNGGCNSDPPVFGLANPGDVIRGTAGFDGATRDTDWWQFALPERTQVTWTVNAEFDTLIGFIDLNAGCPASGFVPGTAALGQVSPETGCVTTTTTACLSPGLWVAFVAPQFTTNVPCLPGFGDYVATLTGAACIAPVNDDCAGAIPVAVGETVSGSTITAAPDAAPLCGTSVSAPGVWYRLIGNGQTITVTTCDPSTSFDSKINVYCGTCAAPICVGGNDDAGPACQINGLHSRVEFCSRPGAVYLVLVQGFNGQQGKFALSVSADGVSCAGGIDCPSSECRADFNKDGLVNSQDFFDFLIAFFAGDADFNKDGLTNSQDFFDFLVVFFSGC